MCIIIIYVFESELFTLFNFAHQNLMLEFSVSHKESPRLYCTALGNKPRQQHVVALSARLRQEYGVVVLFHHPKNNL